MRPSPGVEAFGVCLRGEGDYRDGSELSFRPAEKHVQFAHPSRGSTGESKQPVGTTMSGDQGAMPPVEGLNESFTVEIVTLDRILDVCIDNRRTFIARRRIKVAIASSSSPKVAKWYSSRSTFAPS